MQRKQPALECRGNLLNVLICEQPCFIAVERLESTTLIYEYYTFFIEYYEEDSAHVPYSGMGEVSICPVLNNQKNLVYIGPHPPNLVLSIYTHISGHNQIIIKSKYNQGYFQFLSCSTSLYRAVILGQEPLNT